MALPRTACVTILVLLLACSCSEPRDPRRAHALNESGLALYGQRQFSAALEDFQDAIRFDPDKAEYWNNAGMARLQLQEFAAATGDFRNALRIRPAEGLYHFNLGMAHLSAGAFALALQAFRQTIRREPDHAEAHFQAGSAAFALKEYGEALAHWNKAMNLRPTPMTATRMGALYLSEKRLTESDLWLQRALGLDPAFPLAHYNLGVLRRNQGDFARARTHFTAALQGDAGNLPALFNLGLLEAEHGDAARARPLLERFLQTAPVAMAEQQGRARRALERLASGPN